MIKTRVSHLFYCKKIVIFLGTPYYAVTTNFDMIKLCEK